MLPISFVCTFIFKIGQTASVGNIIPYQVLWKKSKKIKVSILKD